MGRGNRRNFARCVVAGQLQGQESQDPRARRPPRAPLPCQRILLRQRPALSNAQQQNVTRWAVWAAATLLRRHKPEWEALQGALAAGKSVGECAQAIEAAKA